ncbi:type VI secretion system-associated protein VasI [Salinivibrio proteolyticus]|uniref:Type VI secretion system-associated protein VasI n=1 Tax=Salinivibrio proteolyticus TaxID=334715 RepID=A0ABY7LME8_9GAMM|nr:type VI secretion system-associated protein VasI [Salinivibrio proteolyticus]WBA16793.1 type VI secretion system-associated protein VasI [Salinivibrio proteolyticus]
MNTHNHALAMAASVTLLCASFSSTAAEISSVKQLEQAQQCRVVPSRLDRLACFDRVFNTQLSASDVAEEHATQKPQQWRRAMDAANAKAPQTWSLTEQGEGRGSSAWITLQANNVRTRFKASEQPVLMLSCIDNLSRIELMLPEPIDDGRVKMTFPQGQTQYWRSDDVGVVLSSSRGLPAIRLMKSLSSQDQLVIRSNSRYVDGLRFDTAPLNNTIHALRERCGW